jgi:glycosyltransferase involved in cell wall biosynthesis
MNISIVMPCYNTRESIQLIYQRLLTILKKCSDNFEIIFVDDGSPQNDWEVIEQIATNDQRVKLIKLIRNFGQQTAISAGLKYADSEWVVVMDADLQDKPEEIPKLLVKAKEGFDFVCARRQNRVDTFIKISYSAIFHRVFRILTGIETDNTVGNFGIYNRKVIDAFLKLPEQFRGFGLLIKWLGFKAAFVDVEHQDRVIGKTSYDFRKGLNLAIDAFIAFSDKPLKIAVWVGFFVSFLSLSFGFIVFIRALIGYRIVLGWTSLIFSIWFLSGVIILIMGILGLYVGKVFNETKHRPHYIIEFSRNIDEKV